MFLRSVLGEDLSQQISHTLLTLLILIIPGQIFQALKVIGIRLRINASISLLQKFHWINIYQSRRMELESQELFLMSLKLYSR
jgi:hypothetical protein